MLTADLEVISAADDPEVLTACRVLTRVRGACVTCGFAARGGLHAPEICHGVYCGAHCPVCTGVVAVSAVERNAMATNRAAQGHAPRFIERRPVGPGSELLDKCVTITKQRENIRFMAGSLRERLFDIIEDQDGMTVAELLERCASEWQIPRASALAALKKLAYPYGIVRLG